MVPGEWVDVGRRLDRTSRSRMFYTYPGCMEWFVVHGS